MDRITHHCFILNTTQIFWDYELLSKKLLCIIIAPVHYCQYIIISTSKTKKLFPNNKEL